MYIFDISKFTTERSIFQNFGKIKQNESFLRIGRIMSVFDVSSNTTRQLDLIAGAHIYEVDEMQHYNKWTFQV